MSSEKGMTILELLVVVSIGSILLAVVAAWSIPWMAKESMRSAVYEVQTYLQLARIESVSRNHPCRFMVDTGTRTIRVFDTRNTASPSDDEMLLERVLSDAVSFAEPQGGAPVTLFSLGSNRYHTVFDSDGTVLGGSGSVALYGGDRYARVSVYDAGGLMVERWDGNGWHPGS